MLKLFMFCFLLSFSFCFAECPDFVEFNPENVVYCLFGVDDAIAAAIIGAIASTFATLAGTATSIGVNQSNIKLQEQTNQTNIDLANSQFQRSKEDAVKAGFSPLVASGINPSNVTVSSPRSTAGTDIASMLSGLASNFSSLGVEATKVKSTESENEKTREHQYILDRARMTHEDKVLAEQLKSQSTENAKERTLKRELEKMVIKSNEYINNENIGAKREEFNKQLSLKIKELNLEYRKMVKEYAYKHKVLRISHEEFLTANTREWVQKSWSNLNGTVGSVTGAVNPRNEFDDLPF